MSYNQRLSLKFAKDSYSLMNSCWYQSIFQDAKIAYGNHAKHKIVTEAHGFRLATSVGGMLLGEGADYIVVDDPLTPLQSYSAIYRDKVIDWFENSLVTRLNNKKKGAIIIIMQRLHMNDLTGHLLKKGGWHLLKLPAFNYSEEKIIVGNFSYIRPKGHLLCPQKENMQDLQKIKKEIGEYTFESQYQQNPILENGSLFRKEWLQYYDQLSSQNKGELYQSWDTSGKTNDNNDYSVCTTWLIINNKYHLIDLFRAKVEYPELKQQFISLYNQYKPMAILIEDKSTGLVLAQEMSKKYPVISITPCKSKLNRALAISSLFESKKVYIKNNSIWKLELERELLLFPKGNHDDQVDSISQFLGWYNSKNPDHLAIKIRLL